MSTNCLLSFNVINKVNKAVISRGNAIRTSQQNKKTLRGPAATVKNYFSDSTS